jgi:acetoin utilization protein AcuB
MAQGNSKIRNIRVADWMSEGVLAVETFDSIAVARQLMAKHRINQLPVLDDDHLIGIVTDRDIRDAYPTSMIIDRTEEIDKFAAKVTVEEVMTRDIFVVRPETPLDQAVSLLRKHRIGSLPVVKHHELVGIITRSDILDFVLSPDGRRQPSARAKPIARKSSRKGAKAQKLKKK